LAGLRKITQEVVEQQGVTIAEAEYWSDAFDRWAEDLVDPASKGQCPGGKSKGSLPPSIVLEVMQILEAEMNLRDRTRVAEQSKPAAPAEQYQSSVKELVDTQKQLRDRIVVVGEKIEELPDGSKEFAKEIELMQMVELAMNDAWSTLKRPDTGKAAVAAETEAIELLLSSKRINPKSKGGGGGSNPGGGDLEIPPMRRSRWLVLGSTKRRSVKTTRLSKLPVRAVPLCPKNFATGWISTLKGLIVVHDSTNLCDCFDGCVCPAGAGAIVAWSSCGASHPGSTCGAIASGEGQRRCSSFERARSYGSEMGARINPARAQCDPVGMQAQ